MLADPVLTDDDGIVGGHGSLILSGDGCVGGHDDQQWAHQLLGGGKQVGEVLLFVDALAELADP